MINVIPYCISIFLIFIFVYYSKKIENGRESFTQLLKWVYCNWIKNIFYLKNSPESGRQLAFILGKMSSDFKLGRPFVKRHFPAYKFYHFLVEKISYYYRQFGIEPEESLNAIQLALIRDYKFEQKTTKIFWGGYSQFFLLAAIVWGFIFVTNNQLDLPLGPLRAIIIMTLQIFGSLIYSVIFKLLKNFSFRGFSEYFESLYILELLSEVDLPIKISLEKSGIQLVLNKNKGRLHQFDDEILEVIRKWKNEGIPPAKEISIILDLIWFEMDTKFEFFIKTVQITKFFITAIFFLSSYFVFILSLFDEILKI